MEKPECVNQDNEKKNFPKKRRVRPIPITSKIPLYDKLMAEREERSVYNDLVISDTSNIEIKTYQYIHMYYTYELIIIKEILIFILLLLEAVLFVKKVQGTYYLRYGLSN